MATPCSNYIQNNIITDPDHQNEKLYLSTILIKRIYGINIMID